MLGEMVRKWRFVYEVFCTLAPFSERKWPLRAHEHIPNIFCHVGPDL